MSPKLITTYGSRVRTAGRRFKEAITLKITVEELKIGNLVKKIFRLPFQGKKGKVDPKDPKPVPVDPREKEK